MSTLLDPPHSEPDPLDPPAPTRTARRTRTTPRTARPTSASGWFRAFWRWHFYASFLVAPVLLVLATTGLIYLLRFQVEPLLHADTMTVDRPAGAQQILPYSAQAKAVTEAYPKLTQVSMVEPSAPDRATIFNTTAADGSLRDVYVDPWTAKVTGTINPDTTLSGYAVRVHADLMTGTIGDVVIELAACWAIVMALTGYYLFFRGRRARLRSRARGAALRRTHSRIGLVAGVGVLVLIVSGLPWTGFWGVKAQELVTAGGTSFWSLDHGAQSNPSSTMDESLPHSHAVPWAQGKSERPQSDADAADAGLDPATGERNVANVDTAVTVAADAGLRHPLTVALPDGEQGVFSVIGYAFDAPSDEKTVHIDRFSGKVVSTYGYDDYPRLAKVVAQGIGLHEGRSLGWWSFFGAMLMCLAVIAACVTGPLMWWKRRPRGSSDLAAPRGRLPVGASPVLLVGLVALGLFLPFFGLSLLAVLALDRWVLRRSDRLGAFFNTA